jgi:hypothetical protein
MPIMQMRSLKVHAASGARKRNARTVTNGVIGMNLTLYIGGGGGKRARTGAESF